MSVDVIVACDENYGIGLKGKLPWNIPEELKIFRKKTQDCVLLVGRKTAINLPLLPGRTVICLSSSVWQDFPIDEVTQNYPGKKIFVCGGAETYRRFLSNPERIGKLHISIMKGKYDCDTFLDIDLSKFCIVEEQKHEQFTHYVMKYNCKGEKQYLDLLRKVISTGKEKEGRNGITKSLFFDNITFDLREGFPLLTTK